MPARNRNLDDIANDLRQCLEDEKADEFIYYLLGVVKKQKKAVKEATSLLLKSVQLRPTLYCSWLELLGCVNSLEEVSYGCMEEIG